MAIISETDEALYMPIRSYGRQIWLDHSQGPYQQKPCKILAKRERGHIQGLPKFFMHPNYLEERVKLRTFVGIFTA